MARFWCCLVGLYRYRAGGRRTRRIFSRVRRCGESYQSIVGRHARAYDVTLDNRKTGVYPSRHAARWFAPSFDDVMELWVDGKNCIPSAWIRETEGRYSF